MGFHSFLPAMYTHLPGGFDQIPGCSFVALDHFLLGYGETNIHLSVAECGPPSSSSGGFTSNITGNYLTGAQSMEVDTDSLSSHTRQW